MSPKAKGKGKGKSNKQPTLAPLPCVGGPATKGCNPTRSPTVLK